MIQALNHRPVNAEARLRHQANRSGICGRQSCTETVFFSPGTSVSPVVVIAPALIHSSITDAEKLCSRQLQSIRSVSAMETDGVYCQVGITFLHICYMPFAIHTSWVQG